MAKKFIGHCTCPECGNDEAEVKETKNGRAYRWCPDYKCLAQYFPKNDEASRMLIATCHTLAAEPEPGQPVVEQVKPALAPVPQPKPAPVPKAGPFDFILHKQKKEGAPA